MTLEINGLNIVPYIAYGGLQWQREDVDGPGAGRDLSGNLRRERVSTKRRLDVTCRLLDAQETKQILTAIMPEFVSVRYYDPQEGKIVIRTMYSNNNPAMFQIKNSNGKEYWSGITFPLIEK